MSIIFLEGNVKTVKILTLLTKSMLSTHPEPNAAEHPGNQEHLHIDLTLFINHNFTPYILINVNLKSQSDCITSIFSLGGKYYFL